MELLGNRQIFVIFGLFKPKMTIFAIYTNIYIYVHEKCYPEQYEVAQLQKKFFLEFVYLPCFQSGIMVFCSMLPKNPILDHFYG